MKGHRRAREGGRYGVETGQGQRGAALVRHAACCSRAAAAGGQAAAGQRADIDELKAALDGGATMLLIDVREDWEVASGSMPGSIHIPVAELERRMPDIPQGRAARLLLKRRRPKLPCCGALHRERIPGGGILRPERLEVERLRAGARPRSRRRDPSRRSRRARPGRSEAWAGSGAVEPAARPPRAVTGTQDGHRCLLVTVRLPCPQRSTATPAAGWIRSVIAPAGRRVFNSSPASTGPGCRSST